jgi:uncharacterized protein YqgC (DUF456 family)
MTVPLIVLAAVCMLVGLIGCVIPGIAGPPFSFAGLILLSIAKGWQPFSPVFLLIMAIFTVVVTALDFLIPAVGARRFGASRAGFWGALAGLILGLLVFPPFGMVLGAFLGAIIAEMLGGKKSHEALRAGWGVFLGVLAGMLLKLVASGIMTFYFIKALF